MRIIWSPLAIERIIKIAGYIAKDKPSTAKKWINTIFSKVKKLELSPEIGRFVPETKNRRFREFIYGNYRIIYHIEKNQLSVLTAHHSKQILPVDEIME